MLSSSFELITENLSTASLNHPSSVQSLSRVWLFATPWTATCQPSLSITNSQSLFKCMSIESVMPSNHLIFCHPLLLLPSIFPSIKVFSNELVLHIRWPKHWSFSFSISPSEEPKPPHFVKKDSILEFWGKSLWKSPDLTPPPASQSDPRSGSPDFTFRTYDLLGNSN